MKPAKKTAKKRPKQPKPRVVLAVMTNDAGPNLTRAVSSTLGIADALVVLWSGGEFTTPSEVAGIPVREWRYRTWDDDFGEARNVLLRLAERTGAEWALMLDSDEWLELRAPPALVVASLNGEFAQADAVRLHAADGTYTQPRFFRLPAFGQRGHFEGPVHEAWNPRNLERVKDMTCVTFAAHPKSADEKRAKFDRDRVALEAYTAAHPSVQRWWYYLGQTYDCLVQLGDRELWQKGIDAYLRAAACKGWDEEGGWAAYRAAVMRSSPPTREVTAEDRESALEIALLGVGLYPACGELAWLCGYLAYYLGRYVHAAAWAEMAITLGYHSGHGRAFRRTLFQDLEVLYEKPYELAAFAWERLGNHDLAQRRRQSVGLAREMRLGLSPLKPRPYVAELLPVGP